MDVAQSLVNMPWIFAALSLLLAAGFAVFVLRIPRMARTRSPYSNVVTKRCIASKNPGKTLCVSITKGQPWTSIRFYCTEMVVAMRSLRPFIKRRLFARAPSRNFAKPRAATAQSGFTRATEIRHWRESPRSWLNWNAPKPACCALREWVPFPRRCSRWLDVAITL